MSANGHNGDLTPRELAALASAWLLVDAASKYGLITAGPTVNVERCEEVLEQTGIVPSEDEVDAAVISLLAEVGTVRQ